MVFERFLGVVFASKCFKSLEGEFVKKLTKPRPWRQNQESTYLKFIKKFEKNTENYYFFLTSILDVFFIDFGRVLGPKNQ